MTHYLKHYLRIALATVALLISFSTTVNSAFAQVCSSNCLRVYSIELRNLGTYINGTVKLTDETGAGAGARGTVVHAIWMRPDGTTFDQYANIGTRLRAEFRLYTTGAPGTYTLTVAGATKAGYTFDPDGSVILSEAITVGATGNLPPTAVPNADVISGSVPLTVNFDSFGSSDADGTIVGYAWDFGDGGSSAQASPSHIYNGVGSFNASLTVTDDRGATGTNSITITVADDNAGCLGNCMSVDTMALSYKVKTSRLKGLVWLVDENNDPVKNAVVHAVWTLPDGTTVDQYGKTSKRSRAKFILAADTPGTYTLSIVEISKASYTFDPDSSNVLAVDIDITP